MENKKEIKPILQYTNEEGTQSFKEGDTVICFAGSKIHSGTIVAFGNYKESEDSDPQTSLYLDTSKDNMNRSCEIIKVQDITYMCKTSVDDMLDYPKIDKELDKHNFVNMIVALGHKKEKADIMYEFMKEFIALYNIPLSRILPCAIREVDLSAEERSAEELIYISSKLLEVMAKVFQSVTDVIKKKWLPSVES